VKYVELDDKWLPTSQAGLGMVEVQIQLPKFVTKNEGSKCPFTLDD